MSRLYSVHFSHLLIASLQVPTGMVSTISWVDTCQTQVHIHTPARTRQRTPIINTKLVTRLYKANYDKTTKEAAIVSCCVRYGESTLLVFVNILVSIWCRILEKDISETIRAVTVKFNHIMHAEVVYNCAKFHLAVMSLCCRCIKILY